MQADLLCCRTSLFPCRRQHRTARSCLSRQPPGGRHLGKKRPHRPARSKPANARPTSTSNPTSPPPCYGGLQLVSNHQEKSPGSERIPPWQREAAIAPDRSAGSKSERYLSPPPMPDAGHPEKMPAPCRRQRGKTIYEPLFRKPCPTAESHLWCCRTPTICRR